MRAWVGKKKHKVKRKRPSMALMARFPENPDAAFSGFRIDIDLPGGRSSIRLEAKGSDGEWAEFANINVSTPRITSGKPLDPFDYKKWCTEDWNTLTAKDRAEITRLIEKLETKPQFTIVSNDTAATQRDLENQLYRHWQVIPEGAGAPDSQEYIIFHSGSDQLEPQALFLLAEAINRCGETRLVYSDEDFSDPAGNERTPRFKPDFDPVLLRESDYVTRLGAFHASLFRGEPPTRNRATEASLTLDPNQVAHIPEVMLFPDILYFF